MGVESRPGSPPPLGTTLAVPACAEECELADVEPGLTSFVSECRGYREARGAERRQDCSDEAQC